MDFGPLKNDTDFITKVTNLRTSLENIDTNIQEACAIPNYDTLSVEEKVKFDLYLSYSINSLFWMLCKLQAIDPSSHGIKNEMARVRQAMVRDKQIHEHKTIRPVIDAKAAGRFIRHGLWEPKKKPQQQQQQQQQRTNQDDEKQPNKKIKFSN